MSKKNRSTKKKNSGVNRKHGQSTGKQTVDASSIQWPEWIVRVYLVVMLGVFPLYYKNQLYEIGRVKYVFFRTATIVMLGLLATELISSGKMFSFLKKPAGTEGKENIGRKANIKERLLSVLSFTDMAVLIYGVVAILSWLCSPFRAETWSGSYHWYMGLVSQLLFVGIYFAVSRFCTMQKWPLRVMGAAGAAVFLLAYLHRFNIDPLGLYDNFSDRSRVLFLGTIGQATIHSNYVCVVMPVMMGVYLYGNRKQKDGRNWMEHVLCGLVLFLGFCTAVTQNSDSVYVGLGLAFLFLLWFALEDLHIWRRYVEIGLLAVSAAKMTGVLQLTFPERVPQLEALSLWVTQSHAGWLLLAVLLAVYGVTWLVERKSGKTTEVCQSKSDQSPEQREATDQKAVIKSKKGISDLVRVIHGARAAFYIVLVLAILLLPVLIWLVTTGKVPAISGVLGETGYFEFGWDWGNGRGRSWAYCMKVFMEYNPFQKLFGCGPDVLTFYSETYHAEELRKMWGDLTLTNAHNEWLTALINFGVVGAAAYLSIFVSVIVEIVKVWRKQSVLLGAGAAVLAYIGHNFFCYQQMVGAPLIFIVLGAAEYMMRMCRDVRSIGKSAQTEK